MRSNASAAPDLVLSRRHAIAAALALPLLGSVAGAAAPAAARAATVAIPPPVTELDRAAMALFDAAEAGRWTAARQALDQARTAADAAVRLESQFVAAGGTLSHFYQMRNDLDGDLVEARTALAAQDRRWLTSAADRIVQRAGELSQPFAERTDALLPRLETLMYLARRMRGALVWQDNGGFRRAHEDFERLWHAVKGDLAGAPPERVRAVDDALLSTSLSKSLADLHRLYAAIEALHAVRAG
jgi:hypothetical protein